MERQTRRLTERLDYVANAASQIRLPNLGLVTQIDLEITLNLTTDASGATPAEDALARLIKEIQVAQDEGTPRYHRKDGRTFKFDNIIKYKGLLPREDSLPTGGGVTQDVTALYRIHPGIKPENPFDPTSGFDTREKNFVLELRWGSASDLGTGYTINSGEARVVLYVLVQEPGETLESIAPLFVRPEPRNQSQPITSVISDFSLEVPLPTGVILRRTLLIALDSAGDRSEADVTELAFRDAVLNKTLYSRRWREEEEANAAFYNLQNVQAGVVALDWDRIAGGVGLDMRGKSRGDQVLAFNTGATGGQILIAHEAYA